MLQQFILWSTDGRNIEATEENQTPHLMIIQIVLCLHNLLLS